MASLSKVSDRYTVQVMNAEGARKTIHLGRISDRMARTIKHHVEELAAARINGQAVDPLTSSWLTRCGDKLHQRIVKAGLAAKREESRQPAPRLDVYFDLFIARRTDLKPASIENLKQTRGVAGWYFGPILMDAVTKGYAEDFRRKMLETKSTATVAMYIKKLRQLYADAIDHKLLTENPFKAVKAGSFVNKSREFYVLQSDIAKAIDKCPDHDWKLIFGLARYVGLRVPSETSLLKWGHIDFAAKRMLVHSPKTEHHEGKATRIVPIPPELLTLLKAARGEESENVISRRSGNLAKTARNIVRSAGLTPWPKFFQNLRSSCETDMATLLPIHAVCAFIGNSEAVARKHYLQVIDDHFDTVTSGAAKSAAHSGAMGRGFAMTQNGKAAFSGLAELIAAQSVPPRGTREQRKFLAKVQSAHKALQSALQLAKRRLAIQSRRDIRRIERGIKSARRSPRLTAADGKAGVR